MSPSDLDSAPGWLAATIVTYDSIEILKPFSFLIEDEACQQVHADLAFLDSSVHVIVFFSQETIG